MQAQERVSPIESFQRALLSWFHQQGRDLPWRRTYLPYHIWVSEIMLQQTQMDRVVGYFNRWIARLPNITVLAAASEREILLLWEGLGYYSRAKNLHRAAKILCKNNLCRLPEDHAALLSLPGIGRYTAGAIMSLAFNRPCPLVDANVERLFARLFNLASPVKEKSSRDFIWQKAAELIPKGQARFFNQALMELGALVCIPRSPRCDLCPIADHCEALRHDLVALRPVPGKAQETIPITMVTGILSHRGRIFIQKRMADDIWPNLWEFPGGIIEEGESPQEALIREYREETGFAILPESAIATIRHNYTRYRVTLHCYHCRLAGRLTHPRLEAAQEYRWVRFADLDNFAFPSPHRRLIARLAPAFNPA